MNQARLCRIKKRIRRAMMFFCLGLFGMSIGPVEAAEDNWDNWAAELFGTRGEEVAAQEAGEGESLRGGRPGRTGRASAAQEEKGDESLKVSRTGRTGRTGRASAAQEEKGDESLRVSRTGRDSAAQAGGGDSSLIQINSPGEAVNQSGRTRMLAMRIATLYGAQASEKLPETVKSESGRERMQAQATMNTIYSALSEFEPVSSDASANQVVADARDIWAKMGRVLSLDPAAPNLLDVLVFSESLLKANEKMTQAVIKATASVDPEIVSVAGRQRMRAMRLARDYIAASIGVDKENRMDMMLETATNFESVMLALQVAEVNTSEITGAINSISKMEWRQVYKSVTECVESNGTKFNELIMLRFTETLLEKTNRLTNLYAGLY